MCIELNGESQLVGGNYGILKNCDKTLKVASGCIENPTIYKLTNRKCKFQAFKRKEVELRSCVNPRPSVFNRIQDTEVY